MDKGNWKDLTEEEEEEALRIAEAARRAERRALERKQAKQQLLQQKQSSQRGENKHTSINNSGTRSNDQPSTSNKVVFISKKRRLELAQQKEKLDKEKANGHQESSKKKKSKSTESSNTKFNGSSSSSHHTHGNKNEKSKNPTTQQEQQRQSHLTSAQLQAIKHSYLGKQAIDEFEQHSSSMQLTEQQRRLQREKEKKKKRVRESKKKPFKFEWDNDEDTSRDVDPFFDYPNSRTIQPAMILSKSNKKRNNTMKLFKNDSVATVESVSKKPLEKMTNRDWRIFRENYNIIVKGGKCPPPIRGFSEHLKGGEVPPIHNYLLQAITKTLRYSTPSPIQRQAIPIGLLRRDLIGIAETGSGKTAAFAIPLCNEVFSLSSRNLDSVADNGPLGLIMAPTRELALQIDAEIVKIISFYPKIKTLPVVGGQAILDQAHALRNGVHIVVGTPGRINDCVESSYLVLNQCCYIVLDEADRMIDLGFAPQIEQILDSMGGILKDSDESIAYKEEKEDLNKLTKGELPKYRLTAMFSATMPSEVERIAKKYLRHPAVVSIGDRDTGKNTRIVQRVIYLSNPTKKVKALIDILRSPPPSSSSSSRNRNSLIEEKIIVFVNEKKHADGVGRIVESAGRRCVVLHGGKAQDQREESLDMFRRGGVVLVATDVAGRGLDIPNVTHVINYNVPQRSIDNYCHRIGRTGRAGKEGYATSFVTDEDESILPELVQYLESTGNAIPDKLKSLTKAASSNFT